MHGQETQRQLLQREAAAVSQRYTTSNEISLIRAILRQLEGDSATLNEGSADIQSLRADIDGSQQSLLTLGRDVSRLDETLTGSLEGIKRMQENLEQQLTKVRLSLWAVTMTLISIPADMLWLFWAAVTMSLHKMVLMQHQPAENLSLSCTSNGIICH